MNGLSFSLACHVGFISLERINRCNDGHDASDNGRVKQGRSDALDVSQHFRLASLGDMNENEQRLHATIIEPSLID